MASPYLLSNTDLQFVNASGQSFNVWLAFLNPVPISTYWIDVNLDPQGNPVAPPNFDLAANKIAPYAPIANMGPNRIGFVGEPLFFDGSRSCQRFDLPVVSYGWSYSGSATSVNYANGSQIALTWASPGIYTVMLTVTDRAGTATTTTRQVMIYQDRAHALPGMIQISGPQGSLSSGGWQCQVNTVSSQFTLFAPDALPIGTYQPAVLMVETSWEVQPGYWINRTLGPFGQFNTGSYYKDPRILFDGYVQTGSVHQDVDKDTLSFTLVGPQMILNDARSHALGFYNCAYTSIVGGVPQGCQPSAMGQGYQVGGLMTVDVVQNLVQYHCNIAQYHDLHLWLPNIPTYFEVGQINATAYYGMQYSSLSVVEGTIWENVQELAANEFANVYCDHDGSIRIGPQVNMRGYEFWNHPTMLGGSVAGLFLNFIQDLGYTLPSTSLQAIAPQLPSIPGQAFPVVQVHPWGPQQAPVPYCTSFQNVVDPTVSQAQTALVGPPILCAFSDTPLYETTSTPIATPYALFPWVADNWPQDLAIYPTSIDIQENYTGKAALVKIIWTLALQQAIYPTWYPQGMFQFTGSGTSNIVTSTLPAGNLIVEQGQWILPDVTNSLNQLLVTNYAWEIARRYYYAQNLNYNATVTLGMSTFAQLGDIVSLTRQNNTLGPHWLGKPFYIDAISYMIDTTNRTWTTQYSLTEVTSGALSPIGLPPTGAPLG